MAEYNSLRTTTCAAPCTACIKGKKALINGNRTPVLLSRATELFLPEGDRVGQSVRPPKRALPPAVRHIRPRLRGRLRGRVAAYEGELETAGDREADHRREGVADDDVGHALDAG